MRNNPSDTSNARPHRSIGLAFTHDEGLARRAYEQAIMSHGMHSSQATLAWRRLQAVRRGSHI